MGCRHQGDRHQFGSRPGARRSGSVATVVGARESVRCYRDTSLLRLPPERGLSDESADNGDGVGEGRRRMFSDRENASIQATQGAAAGSTPPPTPARRPEPPVECATQRRVAETPGPGDMAVGPDQYRRRRSDCPDDRQHPFACIGRLDESHSIRPRRDVNPAGLTQVQQHRARVVQPGEDARGPIGGLQVEV